MHRDLGSKKEDDIRYLSQMPSLIFKIEIPIVVRGSYRNMNWNKVILFPPVPYKFLSDSGLRLTFHFSLLDSL